MSHITTGINREAVISVINTTLRLPVIMQAEAAVCHQCGSREKHGINFKKDWSNDDGPVLMDV